MRATLVTPQKGIGTDWTDISFRVRMDKGTQEGSASQMAVRTSATLENTPVTIPAPNQMRLLLVAGAFHSNARVTIDWGDGTTEVRHVAGKDKLREALVSFEDEGSIPSIPGGLLFDHSYVSMSTEYLIRITSTDAIVQFSLSINLNTSLFTPYKVTAIEHVESTSIERLPTAFAHSDPLQVNATFNSSELPKCFDMSGLFFGWRSFDGVLPPDFCMDWSGVYIAPHAFQDWAAFNSPLPATFLRVMDKLVNTKSMFEGWYAYNQPLPVTFFVGDFPNLHTVDNTFAGWGEYNQQLPVGFFAGQFPKLDNTGQTFTDWGSYNQPLPDGFFCGDYPSLTYFYAMFQYWSSYNQPLPVGFFTGKFGPEGGNSHRINGMFGYWQSFNQPLEKGFLQDFINRTDDMEHVFSAWHQYNQPIVADFFVSDQWSAGVARAISNMFDGWRTYNQILPEHFMEYVSFYRASYAFRGWESYTGPIFGPDASRVPTGYGIQVDRMYYGNTKMTGNATAFIISKGPFYATTQCFRNCTALSDYSSIPTTWK